MPGSIQPDPNFNVEGDCEGLRAAMKGLGTNEERIINIIGNRSREQRLQIALKYKTMYGKDLGAEFRSELSGNFLKLSLYLLLTIPEFLAKELKMAMRGAGTDERALVEVLVGLDNAGVAEVKLAYKQIYDQDLEREVSGETSGSFKKLALSLLTGRRDESEEVDREKAKEDAVELFNAGINRFGTDESKFNAILCTRSFRHLKMVFAEYKVIATEDIEKSIRTEMNGELELGFLSMVKKIKNAPTFFAEELYKSMKGLGTDDDQLIRIVVWRSEIDMTEIKGAFQSLYGKSLCDFVKDDTSGHFKSLLITIIL